VERGTPRGAGLQAQCQAVIRESSVAAPAANKPWLPAALAAGSGAVVLGLVVLLWFGLQQKEIAGSKVVNVPFTQAPDFQLGLFDGTHSRSPRRSNRASLWS